jgi:hypothetical protein
MAELSIAIVLSLSFLLHKGPIHLQCYQVDPQTRVETPAGKILIRRVHRQVFSTLSDWGPNHLLLENRITVMVESEETPHTIAIFDGNDMSHSYVLYRNTALKKRFQLSENVVDSTRLDYCVKVKKFE